jgi:hypothetical protein
VEDAETGEVLQEVVATKGESLVSVGPTTAGGRWAGWLGCMTALLLFVREKKCAVLCVVRCCAALAISMT